MSPQQTWRKRRAARGCCEICGNKCPAPRPRLHGKKARRRCETCRAKHRTWAANWRATHPKESRARSRRANLTRYTLTPVEYDALLKKQGGVCAICKRPETMRRKGVLRALNVDHCHDTKDIRGLLCARCNMAIGLLRDNPKLLRAAIKYLRPKNIYLVRTPALAVRKFPGKGRGVVTTSRVGEGALIEVAPVLLFPIHETKSAVLDRFTFEWDDDTAALALGKASLFNHSFRPNLRYKMERGRQEIRFIALKDILPGTELTINYNFDPEDKSPVGFRVR